MDESEKTKTVGTSVPITETAVKLTQEQTIAVLAELNQDNELDEPFLQPLRWMNTNIAWLGGVIFAVIVSLKIAIAAHLSIIGMDVLVRASGIQEIAFQMIPAIFSFSLPWFVIIAFGKTSKSSSSFAIPIFATTCLLAAGSGVVLVPWPNFVLLVFIEASLSVLLVHTLRRRSEYLVTHLALRSLTDRSNALSSQADKILKSAANLKFSENAIEILERRRNAEFPGEKESAYLEAQKFKLEVKRFRLAERSDKAVEVLEAIMRERDRLSHGFSVGERAKRRLPKDRRWSQSGWNILYTLLFTLVIAGSASAMLTGPLWIPVQEFVPYHGSNFSGYELSDSGGKILIMTSVSREIQQLPAAVLEKYYLCQHANSGVMDSVVQMLIPTWNAPNYPECVN